MFEFTIRGSIPLAKAGAKPTPHNDAVQAVFDRTLADLRKIKGLGFHAEGYTNDGTDEAGRGVALGPVEE